MNEPMVWFMKTLVFVIVGLFVYFVIDYVRAKNKQKKIRSQIPAVNHIQKESVSAGDFYIKLADLKIFEITRIIPEFKSTANKKLQKADFTRRAKGGETRGVIKGDIGWKRTGRSLRALFLVKDAEKYENSKRGLLAILNGDGGFLFENPTNLADYQVAALDKIFSQKSDVFGWGEFLTLETIPDYRIYSEVEVEGEYSGLSQSSNVVFLLVAKIHDGPENRPGEKTHCLFERIVAGAAPWQGERVRFWMGTKISDEELIDIKSRFLEKGVAILPAKIEQMMD